MKTNYVDHGLTTGLGNVLMVQRDKRFDALLHYTNSNEVKEKVLFSIRDLITRRCVSKYPLHFIVGFLDISSSSYYGNQFINFLYIQFGYLPKLL